MMLAVAPSRHALLAAFAVWTAILAVILWREAAALGAHHTYQTASFYLQAIRRDRVGRFLVLPFLCWMFIHIGVAPRWLGTNPNNWRLWIGLAIGFAWALCETFGWLGMKP
ncbi:MAG: hypothetical protein ACHQWU_04940 [Gemmatimonadales bacterium]